MMKNTFYVTLKAMGKGTPAEHRNTCGTIEYWQNNWNTTEWWNM